MTEKNLVPDTIVGPFMEEIKQFEQSDLVEMIGDMIADNEAWIKEYLTAAKQE